MSTRPKKITFYFQINPIITLITDYNLQNKDINNGTLISKIIPWTMATGTILLPEQRLMTELEQEQPSSNIQLP